MERNGARQDAGRSERRSELLTIAAASCLTYLGNRLWTFGDRPRPDTTRSIALFILVNLIAGGRQPWEAATLDDADFRRFLDEEDYLESEYGISSGAADLLKRIFRTNPTARPSLAQIRSNVLRLNTFFAEFEEDYADEEEADDDEESDDDSVASSISSASEDVPAAKPIDISCFLGHKRPLLLLEKRTISDDDFACGFIDGLEGLDFA